MARISTKRKLLRASQTPQSVGEQVQHHMHAIAELFDQPKLTLVIRSSGLEGDLIVTNDEANEVITAIKKYCEQYARQIVMPVN